jgi:hypothetical protein
VLVLLESLEDHAGAAAFRREGVLERSIDAVPGSAYFAKGNFAKRIAFAVEADARGHFDPDRVVKPYADVTHYREQFGLGAEAGATVGQVAAASLEYGNIPTDSAQQIGREQSGEGAADHQGARSIHARLQLNPS